MRSGEREKSFISDSTHFATRRQWNLINNGMSLVHGAAMDGTCLTGDDPDLRKNSGRDNAQPMGKDCPAGHCPVQRGQTRVCAGQEDADCADEPNTFDPERVRDIVKTQNALGQLFEDSEDHVQVHGTTLLPLPSICAHTG